MSYGKLRFSRLPFGISSALEFFQINSWNLTEHWRDHWQYSSTWNFQRAAQQKPNWRAIGRISWSWTPTEYCTNADWTKSKFGHNLERGGIRTSRPNLSIEAIKQQKVSTSKKELEIIQWWLMLFGTGRAESAETTGRCSQSQWQAEPP